MCELHFHWVNRDTLSGLNGFHVKHLGYLMVNCLAILSFTVAHLGLSLYNNTLSGTVFNTLCRQCGNICLQMRGLIVHSFNKRMKDKC